MASETIYRTPDGEKILMEIYDRQLRSLNTEYDSGIVQTRFGKTHVITAGNKSGKPLVIFHGGNSTNPYNLKAFLPLLENFRIYAPDTLEMVESVFKHVDVKAEMPRNAHRDELAGFNAPVMVIAAARDVLFPGRKVLKRAGEIFPKLEKSILLDESPHMYFNNKSDRDRVNRLLGEFFI